MDSDIRFDRGLVVKKAGEQIPVRWHGNLEYLIRLVMKVRGAKIGLG